MYQIKHFCEDFKVFEEYEIKTEEMGKFAVFELTKKDYTTPKAVEFIANALRIPQKRLTYAGNKDKQAITTQLICAKGISREKVENIDIKDMKIKFLGFVNEPISLGDLKANRFEIVVRNILEKPKKIDEMFNIFGEQRFSINNAEVGKLIVKREYQKACKMIMEQKGDQEKILGRYLEEHPEQYVQALTKIQIKILLLYIHSYQSYIWNETLKRCIEKNIDVDEIPLVGFDIPSKDKNVLEIIKDILNEEGITKRDFIIFTFAFLIAPSGLI